MFVCRATLTEFGVATPVVAQLTDLYLSQIDTLTKHMLETGIYSLMNLFPQSYLFWPSSHLYSTPFLLCLFTCMYCRNQCASTRWCRLASWLSRTIQVGWQRKQTHLLPCTQGSRTRIVARNSNGGVTRGCPRFGW